MKPSWKDIFILAFLALQLYLPLNGFLNDKLETRGDFSWNMYSRRYSCRIGYLKKNRDGTVANLDHKQYFVRRSRATKVFHRDDLPAFHAYLCDTLRKDPEFWTLNATVGCRINKGERVTLVPHGVDICSEATDNYGVLRE